MYIRKTEDEYEIQGYYPQTGWEMVTTEVTLKLARAQKKHYQENEPGICFKVVKKRVPIMEKYVITGEQTIRDVVEGVNREQAEMKFRLQYRGVKITSVLDWKSWTAKRNKALKELKSTLKTSAEKHFGVKGVKVSIKGVKNER